MTSLDPSSDKEYFVTFAKQRLVPPHERVANFTGSRDVDVDLVQQVLALGERLLLGRPASSSRLLVRLLLPPLLGAALLVRRRQPALLLRVPLLFPQLVLELVEEPAEGVDEHGRREHVHLVFLLAGDALVHLLDHLRITNTKELMSSEKGNGASKVL